MLVVIKGSITPLDQTLSPSKRDLKDEEDDRSLRDEGSQSPSSIRCSKLYYFLVPYNGDHHRGSSYP